MTIAHLTPELAIAERTRLLSEVRFHRSEVRRRLRDLDRLEADCARVGIRLIREPARPAQGETNARRPDSDDR